MSYILDALRKAERDHQVSRVPTLATAHGGADLRRPFWIWPVAAGVLAIGVLVAYTVHWVPGPPVRRDPVAEVTPPPTGNLVASRPNPAAPAPPLEHVPEPAPLPQRDVMSPATERPAVGRAPAEPGIAPRASAASAPPAARVAPDVRPRAGRVGASAAPASRPAAAVAARPAPSPPIARDSVRDPRPVGEAVAQPPAAAPPADGADGKSAPPRLTLDVLVYSDVPAERFVFINGRKYVEGQTIDGEAVIEQITPDGALLRRDGKQIVLQPKLNPYTRPGSP